MTKRKKDEFERLLMREIKELRKLGSILIDAEWLLEQYRNILSARVVKVRTDLGGFRHNPFKSKGRRK